MSDPLLDLVAEIAALGDTSMAPVRPDRLAAAAAKMRRPEIWLNPVDAAAIFDAGRRADVPTPELLMSCSLATALAPLGSIAIVADETVEPGHMRLRDADPEPVTWTLSPIEPHVLAEMDEMRRRADAEWLRFAGLPAGAFGSSEPRHVDSIDPARYWTGIDTKRKASAMIAAAMAGVALSCTRRPWKLTGRARTRALWRKRGRR